MKAKFLTLGLALLMTVPAAVVQAQNSDIEIPVQLEDYPYYYGNTYLLNHGFKDFDGRDTVLIINSAEELDAAMIEFDLSIVDAIWRKIDFTTESVIFVQGHNGVYAFLPENSMTKQGNVYTLNVVLPEYGLTEWSLYNFAVISEKIDENSSLVLTTSNPTNNAFRYSSPAGGEVIPTERFPQMGMYNGMLYAIDIQKYDTVYVVNSAEEFEKMLALSTALVASPPFPVDFEKQTVLVVRGREASQNGILDIESVLTKNGDQYNLDVTVTHTGSYVFSPAVWEVFLITDKIDTDFVSLYNVFKASTAIDEIATSEGLVYPTITDGALNLTSAGAYRIFGLQGNTLLSGSAVKGQPIDVSALKSGIYLIQSEGKTGKFIKK
jgi:hypothetical protein